MYVQPTPLQVGWFWRSLVASVAGPTVIVPDGCAARVAAAGTATARQAASASPRALIPR